MEKTCGKILCIAVVRITRLSAKGFDANRAKIVVRTQLPIPSLDVVGESVSLCAREVGGQQKFIVDDQVADNRSCETVAIVSGDADTEGITRIVCDSYCAEQRREH